MCVHRCVCMCVLCALGCVCVCTHIQTWIGRMYSKDATSGEREWNGIGVVSGPEMHHAGSPPRTGLRIVVIFDICNKYGRC